MSIVKLATPGVYVQEIATLPPSVAEVETAIPAFVGYTVKAKKFADGDLKFVPMKISSLSEYEHFFGLSPVEDDNPNALSISVKEPTVADPNYQVSVSVDATQVSKYNLYHSMRLFYDNGGGTCYIISVGLCDTTAAGVIEAGQAGVPGDTTKPPKGLLGGLELAKDIDEVTLLVVPEAAAAGSTDYKAIVEAMIRQTNETKDRFALIDPLKVTLKDKTLPAGDVDGDIKGIRDNTPKPEDGKYAAAYYPSLVTTYNYNFGYSATKGYNIDGAKIDSYTKADGSPDTGQVMGSGLLPPGSVVYNLVNAAFKTQLVTLPPSPAMAGIYTRVDHSKGVWKAPANESVYSVLAPSVTLSDREQEGLNIDSTSGKSINVIRAFPGYGPLVWGARTLNGNDNEWRYISVRRFFNMVEESVKKSIQWAVFEPNTAGTWIKVQAMIENYLFLKWREGALAGAKPEQAFVVRVGLGTTMTALDVLEGRMNIEIGMAVARPAEFIVLKFSQLMQQS